jgi:glucuronate isomerase
MNIEILDYINSLEIIDTHEHLMPFEKQREHNDVISEFLTHYFSVDLVTSGLSLKQLDQVRGNEMSVIQKWNCIEKYWEQSKFTGYGQAVTIAASHIYGIDEINRGSIEELNRRYLETFNQQHYHKIIKEKSKIKVAILDRFGERECDKDYFIMANFVHPMIYPTSDQNIVNLETEAGISISTLDDYLRACEKRIDNFLKSSKILKCALAYSRSLDFTRTAYC